MAKINVIIDGVLAPQMVRYTMGHGGVGKLIVRMVPQTSLPAVETNIVLTDGITTLNLTGCRLDRSSIVRRGDGWIQRVEYFDRQWKWRFGALNGVYNVRTPDGDITRELDPRSAALLCFSAMMEPVPPDLLALPNDANDRPEISWRCTPARSALAWLCERAGCEFGLDVEENRAKIWRLGVGAALPNDLTVQSVDHGADIGEAPDSIVACGGPVLFQSKFKLNAVMLDVDGQWRDKDSDELSYKPAEGWDGKYPFDPLGELAGVTEQALARKTYCRAWQIVSMADGGLQVPEYGPVDNIRQCLPIYDYLAESYNSGLDASRSDAYVEGTFELAGEPRVLGNSAPHTRLDAVELRVDPERGIVFTDVPITKLDGNLRSVEADLYLVCAHRVKHPDTNQFVDYEFERVIANNGTGVLPLPRPEVVRRIIGQYANENLTGSIDNVATVNTQLNAHIDAILPSFQSHEAHVVRYVGIKPISLDGAIRQLTWIVDCGDEYRDGGAWTIAYRNTESERGIPRRRARLRIMHAERDRREREHRDHFRRVGEWRGSP